MRLLLDSCVSGGALTRLRAAAHDVVWSGEWSADPGDEEILARALAEGRVLVTLDKDFTALAATTGKGCVFLVAGPVLEPGTFG